MFLSALCSCWSPIAAAPISKGPTSQSSLDSAYTRATYNHIQSIINTSPSPHSDESTAAESIPQAPPKPISPKLRISVDQPSIPSSSKWQENISIERRNTVASIAQTEPSITLESFDDNILKALCELDVRSSVHPKVPLMDMFGSVGFLYF